MFLRPPVWRVGAVCACVLFATPLLAATIAVPPGGDLQAAIDAAGDGDVITLAPGATYAGNFVLRNKPGVTHHITIRSAAADSLLPGPNVRITPAYASALPKIKSPNSAAALVTATGAHHWKLMFLEFQANLKGYGDIIDLGAGDATQTDLSQVPFELVLDRVYVHGDPALGQKRGIGLNSRDTTIVNSYVSDCKAVGQDSQGIAGWNGPGNFLIENNYIEAATENFLIGGSDPMIPNLVTTNVTFRRNYVTKPLAWRDPIVPPVTSVSATAAAIGGALQPGTYSYKVVARMAAGQMNKAVSVPSTEVTAAVTTTTGAVTVAWSPIAGALDYLVYGRAAGAENVYWRTADPLFIDAGAAGTSGTPASATKWAVKNLFELKNAQDVVVEGNVFENLWIAAQPGYPIVFTPRNQNGTAPWTVVQRVTFRDNVVRHTAGGVNILGTDNLNPSQLTNHISITGNVFDDVGSAWGSGTKTFLLGPGPDAVTIDHNTIVTDDSSIVSVYGGTATSPTPTTAFVYTNNMSAHNAYGIMGANFSPGLSAINGYLPGSVIRRNVLADGSASWYPSDNFFPAVPVWQASFVNFAGRDYHLLPGSPFSGAGTDGNDLGANIDRIASEIANAISGDNSIEPGSSHVQIVTSALADGTYQRPYSQTLACTGGAAPCAWQFQNGALPDGTMFNTATGEIAGTPTSVQTFSITVTAYDPTWPSNAASRTLSATIQPPPVVVSVPATASGQVGIPFQTAATVTGVIGSPIWSIASGALPFGIGIDAGGNIAGTPTTWGTFSAAVRAQDSWGDGRADAKPIVIVVAPPPLAVAATTLPPGRVRVPYQAALASFGGTGSATWTLTSGSLPPGLALSATGAISGTPSAAGMFTFNLTAADAGWPTYTATQTLAITIGSREVVLYASDASIAIGAWSLVADSTAANGSRMWNPNAGAAKITTPLASPVSYFEVPFQAEAGVAYHLWVRGKAEKDSWSNDSVYIQFSDSVDANGAATYRIGTATATDVNLEDCSGCGESGWGWQDNGWGVNVFGPNIFFAQTGTHTLRVQVREDGFSIDQLVLSADKYFMTSPGALKNDTTIVPR